MYKTEKQLTTKQNKVVYEEVYFNSDMTQENYNEGYRLTYPNKFSQNPSQDKSIGIRRVEVIPSPHSINVGVEYNGVGTSQFVSCEYQSDNTLQEILINLLPQLTKNNCYLVYAFDKMTGKLSIAAMNNGVQTTFRFVCRTLAEYSQLWALFNQPGDIPFESYLLDSNFNTTSLSFVQRYDFTNVWNRTPLYFHASFSDSKYHYVCKTDDYWEKPGKLFFDNVHGLEFQVYFTTDGVHKVIPFYAVKLLELSFILRTQEF